MSWYDLTQLIIAILSLIATVAVSVILYHFEQKHDRQIEEQNEKIRRMNLEHDADIFLIQNGDEIEYLPLCVFVNNLNGTKKHLREIYNNYNTCSEELKNIILDKQGIYIRELPQTNWTSACIDRFNDEINKYNLGRTLFYDDGKYVRYCYDYYRKNKIPCNELEFSFPDYHVDRAEDKMIFRKDYKCGLYMYASLYFNYINDVQVYKNLENIEMKPLFQVVYDEIINMDSEHYSYWCAMLMRYTCANLRKQGCEYSLTDNPYGEGIELEVKSFEDAYYCALYELYLTFGKDL